MPAGGSSGGTGALSEKMGEGSMMAHSSMLFHNSACPASTDRLAEPSLS